MNNTEKTYDPEIAAQVADMLDRKINYLLVNEIEALPELFEKLIPAERVNATLRLLEIVMNNE